MNYKLLAIILTVGAAFNITGRVMAQDPFLPECAHIIQTDCQPATHSGPRIKLRR